MDDKVRILEVICKEVALAVQHCVDQSDDSNHKAKFVQHSKDHILTI